jgi:hypothetical protein
MTRTPKRSLDDKLEELARRSPKHITALEVMVDFVLKDLPPEDPATTPYDWRCDRPEIVNPKPKGTK